jgi:transposase
LKDRLCSLVHGRSNGSSPNGSSPNGSSPNGSSPNGSSPNGSSPNGSSSPVRFSLLWADGSYAGKFIEWVKEKFGWAVEIVRKLREQKGFVILPRRWVVERTFAWLGKYRRLSKDYEATTQSSEAVIYGAMIHLMLRRLRPP